LRAITSAGGIARVAERKEKDVSVVLWVVVISMSYIENE
jgi:hypothetical protein